MLNNNASQAHVNQGISLPDYFSCNECIARKWEGRMCERFQRAGRCRADMLNRAIQSGAVQIVLHLPAGGQP